MALSGIHLGRASIAQLDRLLDTAEKAELTYDHIGSTVRDETPPGVRCRTFRRSTAGTLEAAQAALRTWCAHDGINARVHPSDAPITLNQTVLIAAPFGLFELIVPDRLVAVLDEPDRYGFAYGTLTTHAERGEELFLAEQHDDRLELTIRVHALPASILARAGAPVTDRLQAGAARRYLDAWATAINTRLP